MRTYKAYAVSADKSELFWERCYSPDDCRNVRNQIEKQGEGYTHVRYYDCLGGLALEVEIDYD